jgi:minor extracellular serine protease Vpr
MRDIRLEAGVLANGAILNVAYQLVDSSHPASSGDAIQIFCTGLGVVSPEVLAGQPASTTVLSNTVNQVTATIGGLPATVFFQGLAPGYAGLYQVEAYVPSGVASGNQEVVLSAAGQSSPAGVTIAIK